jgi:hypothetical protein
MHLIRDDMDFNKTHQANRVTMALMISQRDEDSISLFTQTTDFGKCRMIWTGQVTNDQGEVWIHIIGLAYILTWG